MLIVLLTCQNQMGFRQGVASKSPLKNTEALKSQECVTNGDSIVGDSLETRLLTQVAVHVTWPGEFPDPAEPLCEGHGTEAAAMRGGTAQITTSEAHA